MNFFFELLKAERKRNLLLGIALQSNAVGWNTGLPSELYLRGIIPKTFIFNNTDFDPLNVEVNNKGNVPESHGIEPNFGYLGSQYFDNIWIVKEAVGATGLEDSWIKSADDLYPVFVARMNAAIAYLKAQGHNFEMATYLNGMEKDSLSESSSNNCQANLTGFISDLRTDITDAQNMKFAITRLKADLNRPYVSTCRTAVENVTQAVSGAYMIDQDDLTFQGDGIHITSASQNIDGQRALMSLI